MCHTEGPGSQPPESSKAQVISLCAHRQRRDIEEATEELISHLESIHHRAIQVHNAVIERADVSVLSELCRTAGLMLDDIDDELRAAVLIPAALYGHSTGEIFGKNPLQERIDDDIDDPTASTVLDRLNNSCAAVWSFESRQDEPTDLASPLAGPDCQQPREVAGILARRGLASQNGLYTGRLLTFRDHDFIVFGHRLDRPREVAVRDMLTAREDRTAEEIWKHIELPLLRALVDPDAHHRWPGRDIEFDTDESIRRPASRGGLLLRIRRAIWRHFAEPDEGLTFHAHLAALADDAEAFEALIDEIEQIADTVDMKAGGLRDGASPIEIDEVLRPFFVDRHGQFCCRGPLRAHPVSVLLMTDVVLDATGLEDDQPIADALQWAADHEGTTPARTIELAWITYSTEQNLVATYGWCTGDDDRRSRPDGELPFARRSPVLPNIGTLFDPRFMEHTLTDLDLSEAYLDHLAEGLAKHDLAVDEFRLADIERDERDLARQFNIDHETVNAIRTALLELATHWRWERAGFDADDFDGDDIDDSFIASGGPGRFNSIEFFDEYLDN